MIFADLLHTCINCPSEAASSSLAVAEHVVVYPYGSPTHLLNVGFFSPKIDIMYSINFVIQPGETTDNQHCYIGPHHDLARVEQDPADF